MTDTGALVTFTAPCPNGHPGAQWRSNPPHTGQVKPNAYDVQCAACRQNPEEN